MVCNRVSQANRQDQTGFDTDSIHQPDPIDCARSWQVLYQKKNWVNNWMVSGYWNGNCPANE